ncbi:MAG: Hpt domain-containing protein [Solirubrobacteraceae bacterium]
MDELRGLGGEDLRDIVELYFADVEVQIERLRSSLDDGDAQSVAAAAHRIKGASLSIGAARVAALASDTEVAGKEGDLTPCPELVQTLEGALAPTRQALGVELAVDLDD